ncbi:MAG: transposase [Vicinamibacteria bacterium]|nr:transposase [Vicinamibacteria bacterium]
MTSSPLSRRGFLTGSSLFAAALSLAASARAQDPAKPDPARPDAPKDAPKKEPPKEDRRRGPKTDEEIFAEQEKAREELLDDEGREYRICPQCGNKMYRQGRVWTCSNCGYNYVE